MKNKIVLVPFPFDDLSSAKVRPAVCLTDEMGQHSHVILAFITSKIPSDLLHTDLVLETSASDFVMTGLKLSSTVRLHRLATVSASVVQLELGELSDSQRDQVDERIRQLFDLNQ